MNIGKVHKNYSHEWYTPMEWMDWVSETLGEWWFDPCPAERPASFDDGLAIEWPGAVYCNHPGGRGQAKVWWSKFHAGMMRHAPGSRYLWCAFSVEQLRHLRPSPFHIPGWLVMPRQRVAFIDGRTGEVAKSPAQWTVFWCNVAPATPPVESIIVRTA